MAFFRTMGINASAMSAQQVRLDVISQNLANSDTTRTEQGGPYQRRYVTFQEISDSRRFSAQLRNAAHAPDPLSGRTRRSLEMIGQGVRVSNIHTDTEPGPMTYDPEHPDADEFGYVHRPNVNVIYEMVNMLSANRAFEMNLTAFNTTKAMAQSTLQISQQR